MRKANVSRTRVHTKLKFVVPPEEIERHQTSWYTIINWKHFYYRYYGRYRGEKSHRKMRNRQERAKLRTSLARMRYLPEEFDNFTPPDHYDTLYDLD